MDEASLEGEHDLTQILDALANPVRLRLLRTLRQPRTASEIRLPAEDSGGRDEDPAVAMSRQAIYKHLHRLEAVGLVVRRPSRRDGQPVDEFIVNNQALFAIGEAVRALAALRPTVEPDAETLPRPYAPPASDAVGPRVIVVNGLDVHVVHALDDHRSEGGRRWTIGRRRSSAVPLDYDPWVSLDHAAIEFDGEAYTLRDDAANRNGTSVNRVPLPRGGACALQDGDLVQVGRTLLLMRLRAQVAGVSTSRFKG